MVTSVRFTSVSLELPQLLSSVLLFSLLLRPLGFVVRDFHSVCHNTNIFCDIRLNS